ncbi:MAG: cytochrome c peroxidase [Bacteroidota bacterium]
MKETGTHALLGGILLAFFVVHFSNWSDAFVQNLDRHHKYIPKALNEINEKFHNELMSFSKEAIKFSQLSETLVKDEISQDKLEKGYIELRESFKKVGFIIEYVDKEAYDKIINGAPLLKLEKKVADLAVLEPHGFQVLDEIMGSDLQATETRQDLVKEAELLSKNVKKINEYLQVHKLSDRHFFEAVRFGIIRAASLGITGFDTPGTLKGISDTQVALKNFDEYLQLYATELNNVNRIGLLDEIQDILEMGIKLTKNEEFDTFNRMKFIKNVINPAYKTVKDIHLALNYETIDEVSRYIQAVNYNAENLFESDFLNSFYYVSLEEDSTYAAKAELGKLLFYDPILSQDNGMSCAACHDPQKAFTDGKTLSLSNTGDALERNAMTLNYSVYATSYFHDLRAKRLEDQFEHVVVSEDEFNSSYEEIIEKVSNSEAYSKRFRDAFPHRKTIKFNDIDYALAAYVMKLNTFDSPIDQYFQGKLKRLPKSVERGFNLFTGKAACATCHFTPLFSGNLPPLFIDTEAEVLGVPEAKQEPWVLDDDTGRINNGVTQDVAKFYVGAFKTPTVRNIELSGPYMHNGVFDTLEEVMDFYNKGGGAGNGMELEHQTLASDPLNLSDREIEDIIAFMNALTDSKRFEKPKDLPRDFEENSINERTF